MNLSLDEKDRRLLQTIANWREGVPTAVLLASALGYASEGTMRFRFKRLEGAGWIRMERVGGKLNVPRLTEQARVELGHLQAPAPREVAVEMHPAYFREDSGCALKGRPISCGTLRETEAEADGSVVTIRDPRDLFPTWDTDRDILLLGDGESMFNPSNPHDSIFDGDYIQARTRSAKNGEIVYASYEPEEGERLCTLKVFGLDERTGAVTLTPLNPAYETIVLPGDKVFVIAVVEAWLSLRSWNRRK